MATRFDASTEFYSATGGSVGTDYSMTCWVYQSVNRAAYSCIAAFESTASSAPIYHEIGVNAANELFLFNNGGTDIYSQLVPAVNTWYRIGVSVAGATATIYQGGATFGALTATSGACSNGSRAFTFIGTDSYSEWWNGRIAAVKVWNAALNATEIAAEFTSYWPIRTTNILRVHPLRIPQTTDYSGNANTLSGGTGTTTEADPPIPEMFPAPLVTRAALVRSRYW